MQHRNTQALVESLERRDLFTVNVIVTPIGGGMSNIDVVSDQQGDYISCTVNAQLGKLTVYGNDYFFGVGSGATIKIVGNGGDDTIIVHSVDAALNPEVIVEGGEGVDTISTETPKTDVDGGPGDDIIYVYNAKTTAHGGDDDDLIVADCVGNAQTLKLYGDAGNDVLDSSNCTGGGAYINGGGDDDDIFCDNGVTDVVNGGTGASDDAWTDAADVGHVTNIDTNHT